MSLRGYRGNPPRNKWDELLVELIAIGVTLAVFGLQVGAWVILGVIGLRLFQIGKEVH